MTHEYEWDAAGLASGVYIDNVSGPYNTGGRQMKESLTREEIDIILRLRQRVMELEAEICAIDGQMRKLRLDAALYEKDAERYRKIRNGIRHMVIYVNDVKSAAHGMWLSGEYLDSFVDAGKTL